MRTLLSSNASVRSLLEDSVTSSRDKDIGLVATSIGLSCSFILAMYKFEIGNQLQSLTISAGFFSYLLLPIPIRKLLYQNRISTYLYTVFMREKFITFSANFNHLLSPKVHGNLTYDCHQNYSNAEYTEYINM